MATLVLIRQQVDQRMSEWQSRHGLSSRRWPIGFAAGGLARRRRARGRRRQPPPAGLLTAPFSGQSPAACRIALLMTALALHRLIRPS
jgi:hypothetical protein